LYDNTHFKTFKAPNSDLVPLLAGENHFALLLNGSGYVALPTAVNNYLLDSFTLELWFYSEPKNVYQPLISHGLHGEWNAKIDFNLQVSSKGTLTFFMGNGENSAYGFNIAGPSVSRNTWHHAAVAVEQDEADQNPSRARLFLDGQLVAEQKWIGGNRRLLGTPVTVGKVMKIINPNFSGWFDNTDPGVQTFYGQVDEVRIWDSFRTPTQVQYTYGHRVGAEESVSLVAYYRFEDPYASTLYDETESFDAFPYDLEWATAGVQFPAFYTVDSTERVYYIVDLPYSDYEDGFKIFTISSLPTEATLFVVDDNDNVLQKILTAPFNLENNRIAFLAEFYLQNGVFTFEYQVTTSDEISSSDVVFNVMQGITCDGIFGSVVDSCGVCGGDDTDCQCVWGPGFYKGFGLSELDKIMAFYSVETTLQLLQEMRGNLVALDEQLDWCKNSTTTLDLSLAPVLSVLNNFQSKALDDVENTAEEVQNLVLSV
jgi:hypothetical protein